MGVLRAVVDPAGDTVRDLAALPASSMRRALLAERLARLDAAAAATLIEGMLARAARCEPAAWPATMALCRWQLDLRQHDPARRLQEISEAAASAGQGATRAFCDDAPARKSLRPRGRLAEVSVPERRSLRVDPQWRLNMLLIWCRRLLLHPSTIMASRLLEQPWFQLRDALVIASRRPSSPGIALAVVESERWMRLAPVREALAMNPFTPTGTVLALLPTLRAKVLQHLRDGGDVHPLVAEAARCFLELRRVPLLPAA